MLVTVSECVAVLVVVVPSQRQRKVLCVPSCRRGGAQYQTSCCQVDLGRSTSLLTCWLWRPCLAPCLLSCPPQPLPPSMQGQSCCCPHRPLLGCEEEPLLGSATLPDLTPTCF